MLSKCKLFRHYFSNLYEIESHHRTVEDIAVYNTLTFKAGLNEAVCYIEPHISYNVSVLSTSVLDGFCGKACKLEVTDPENVTSQTVRDSSFFLCTMNR